MAKKNQKLSGAAKAKAATKPELSPAATRRERQRQMEELKAKDARKMRMIITGGIVVMVAIIVVVVAVVINAVSPSKDQLTPMHASDDGKSIALTAADVTVAQPSTPEPTTDGETPEPTETTPAADPVTLDIYMDFNCPHCATHNEQLGSVFDQLLADGSLNVNYHVMSFYSKTSIDAAEAALCADNQDLFDEARNAIFAKIANEGYKKEFLRDELPSTIGLSGESLTTYQQCFNEQQMYDFADQMQQKNQPDVDGTPTFFANGTKFDFGSLTATDKASVLAYIQQAASASSESESPSASASNS
jgi:protein-disulfide isomerase